VHFIVTQVLRLPAGSIVGLSESQVARRKHALEAVPKRKGWYTATLDLCFKVGEAIQYDGELPKVLANAVDAPKREGKPAGGSKKPPAGKTDDAAGDDAGDSDQGDAAP
jgi:hypothetical protein